MNVTRNLVELLATLAAADNLIQKYPNASTFFTKDSTDSISKLSDVHQDLFEKIYDTMHPRLEIVYENENVVIREEEPFGLGAFASRSLKKGDVIENCHLFVTIENDTTLALENFLGKERLRSTIDVKGSPHLLLGVTQFVNNCCSSTQINVKPLENGSLEITQNVEANEPLHWYYGRLFFHNLGIKCRCSQCVEQEKEKIAAQFLKHWKAKKRLKETYQVNALKNLHKK
jgi:hypothetical protein